jgi:hypothetical protein
MAQVSDPRKFGSSDTAEYALEPWSRLKAAFKHINVNEELRAGCKNEPI